MVFRGVLLTLIAGSLNMPSTAQTWSKQLKHRKSRPISYAQSGDCPQFQGKWRGRCTDQSGQSTEASVAIHQSGCGYIELDDESLAIPGTRTSSRSEPDLSHTVTCHAKWENSALLYSCTSAFQFFETNRTASAKSSWRLFRTGDRLESHWQMSQDGADPSQDAEICVYSPDDKQ